MSNLVAALTATTTAPAVFTREQIKGEISALKSDAIHALGSVSQSAARESFVKTCTAIAVQRAVFGQDEIYRTICERARKLAEYKTNKHGVVVGALGKFLTGLGDAVAVGKVLADRFSASENEVNLSVFFDSPTFAALIAAPKKAVPPSKEELAAAEKLADEKAAIVLAAQNEAESKAKAVGTDEEKAVPTEEEKAAIVAAREEEKAVAQKALEKAAIKAAQDQAEREASAPYFVGLFAKVADANQDQARAMLAEMASLLGLDVVPHVEAPKRKGAKV